MIHPDNINLSSVGISFYIWMESVKWIVDKKNGYSYFGGNPEQPKLQRPKMFCKINFLIFRWQNNRHRAHFIVSSHIHLRICLYYNKHDLLGIRENCSPEGSSYFSGLYLLTFYVSWQNFFSLQAQIFRILWFFVPNLKQLL